MSEQFEKIVVENSSSERIDKYLVQAIATLSRQQVQKMISQGKVSVNDHVVTKSSFKVESGDVVTLLPLEVETQNVVAVDIPIEIVYEDDALLVVNKPRGMVTHPAPGHYDDTLVNALLFHTQELSRKDVNADGPFRPGIVHRLDKDTSGLLVIAKNDQVHTLLAESIAKREVKRNYLALVNGVVSHEDFTVDMPIARSKHDRQKMSVDANGKKAKTHFRLIDYNEKYSLLACQLETGRTHQIRVHLESIGHTIVGDPVYSKKKDVFGLGGQFLHAYQLSFIHPISGKQLEFEQEMPKEFLDVLENQELNWK